MGSRLDRHYRAFGSWRASLGANPATMQHEYLYTPLMLLKGENEL